MTERAVISVVTDPIPTERSLAVTLSAEQWARLEQANVGTAVSPALRRAGLRHRVLVEKLKQLGVVRS